MRGRFAGERVCPKTSIQFQTPALKEKSHADKQALKTDKNYKEIGKNGNFVINDNPQQAEKPRETHKCRQFDTYQNVLNLPFFDGVTPKSASNGVLILEKTKDRETEQ